ncbi:MAG: CHAT domain-containing protein [bacterium]|nr:CHAT domain-containing protein [candidate division KSB1 bacterium]MDH7560296.1 CHAT domain-containing protein [bacterium]
MAARSGTSAPSRRRRTGGRNLSGQPGLSPAEHAARLAELGKGYAAISEHLKELETRDPEFTVKSLDCPAVADLARAHNLTLVFLVPTNEADLGTVAFVVSPVGGEPEVLRLTGLTRARLHELLFQLPEGGKWGVELLEAGSEYLGWLAAYWLTHLPEARHSRDVAQKAQQVWHTATQRLLEELDAGLMQPLAAQLQALPAHRVVIIPGGNLALVPLHAAPVAEKGRPRGKRRPVPLFGEEFEVSYAPSATVLAGCRQRVREAATRRWLVERVQSADYVELSTHGSFAPGRPERSALLLAHPEGHTAPAWVAGIPVERLPLAELQAGCERLSLDDIWAGRLPLKKGCVMVLDACETGQVEPGEEAEESLGFPAAFLAAGARAVIASLWAVDDFSTSLLMQETYRRMLAGAPPSLALKQAQHWLRTLPKAETLARLDKGIASLVRERKAGAWKRLDRAQRAQVLYRLAGMEERRRTLEEEAEDLPFAHPFHWAAFAVYGA